MVEFNLRNILVVAMMSIIGQIIISIIAIPIIMLITRG